MKNQYNKMKFKKVLSYDIMMMNSLYLLNHIRNQNKEFQINAI